MIQSNSIEKYFSLILLSMTQGIRNYKVLIGLSIFMFASLVIFSYLWKITATQTGMTVLDPDQLLWYIAFNEWILVSLPDIHDEIEQDFRTGRLAYFLPRPMSYLGAKFAEGAGKLFLNLIVLGIVGFGITAYWTETFPFTLSTFSIALLLGFMAGLLGIIFLMVIGISAFWLQDINAVHWFWEKLLFLFGGLLLPLSVYPSWIQNIAIWTPFPAILGGRSALALDAGMNHILLITLSLIVWSAICTLGLNLLYQRGLRVLNIQGG